jgi:hypothetical protein
LDALEPAQKKACLTKLSDVGPERRMNELGLAWNLLDRPARIRALRAVAALEGESVDEVQLLKLSAVDDDPYPPTEVEAGEKVSSECSAPLLLHHTEDLWRLLSLDERSATLLELEEALRHSEL